jgi:hypothetical protein
MIFAAATAFAAPAEPHIADCERGPVMIGSSSPDWRRELLDAGPLGVRKQPLSEMSRYSPRRPGELLTKMPALVEGHDVVTLSVPPRLRHRVFLYYGYYEGPGGKPSTSFYDSPGSAAIEFRPCADKPRTIWPGGIRVKGRQPVTLTVTVEGRSDPVPLRLGRPQLYRPPAD